MARMRRNSPEDDVHEPFGWLKRLFAADPNVLLRQHGFDRKRQKAVRRFFDEQVELIHREYLEEQTGLSGTEFHRDIYRKTQRDGASGYRDKLGVGRGGKQDLAEPSRKPKPEWPVYLLYAIAKNLKFRDNKEVALEAISRTLNYISDGISDGIERPNISSREADNLRYVVKIPWVILGREPLLPAQRIQLARRFARSGKQQDDTEIITNARKLLDVWYKPWHFLNASLPYGWLHWGYFDDEA